MRTTLEKIFASLQLMKEPWRLTDGARWYVMSGRESLPQGPYHAPELAYLIYKGDVSQGTTVTNARHARRYVVGEHGLAQWLRGSRDLEPRILRGLLRCIREYTERLGCSVEDHLGGDLTDDERRALGILELAPTCTIEDVKRRHRALAVRFHPDRGGDTERMQEINWAYGVVQTLLAA